ncbi:hypothetical protein [Bacteroides faecium]|uniref:Lipoprotein n=1 Tax=Bacteroides faecium TaxID=2715212 RepID=A0A6H0KQM5_9BACE|nr:hypothetical protein [Bacteroides faecium]QIU95331.1 hypothetical protein BacF7301_14780 [Bacteroides faecium]
MKQMKFLLVALMAVVMGISVTSCMNGEENNGPFPIGVVAKLETSYSGYFKMIDGTKLVPTAASSINMPMSSGMYAVTGQYNNEDVDVNAGAITFTLASSSNIDGTYISSTEVTPDITLYALEYQNVYPYLFDKNTLVIPAMIWAKGTTDAEVAEDSKKHSLKLTYDEIEAGDTELILHLNDVITEDKEAERKVLTVKHQAYDFSDLLSKFGGKLKKITIKAKINSSSYDLKHANTKDGSFEIDYSKITQ